MTQDVASLDHLSTNHLGGLGRAVAVAGDDDVHAVEGHVALDALGVVIGLVVLSNLSGSYGYIATTLLGGPLFIWNMIVSAGIFIACRNLLNNTE